MTPNERTHAERPSDASIARVFFAMYEEINLAGIGADAFAKVAIGKARELDAAKPAQAQERECVPDSVGARTAKTPTIDGNVDMQALQEQAEAWQAVFETLNEVSPGWISVRSDGTGVELACEAIRKLATPQNIDRSIALAIDWARGHAGEHAAVIENALAAYDPERVGARTVSRAAQAREVRSVLDLNSGDPFPLFIEAESSNGKSITLPWHDRPDGLVELRLYDAQPAPEAAAGEPVAYCDPSDPINSTAFSWPGTDRARKHDTPLYLRQKSARVRDTDACPTRGNATNPEIDAAMYAAGWTGTPGTGRFA